MISEQYQGVKFETIFLEKTSPQHPLLEELKKWCRIFHEKGLAPPYTGGSYGNLSFRSSDTSFIITGTCIGLKDRLDDSCFVEVLDCDMVKRKVFVKGTRLPSSESFLHWTIYHHQPHIGAVFHGHHHEITFSAEKYHFPITAVALPYGTPELAESIVPLLQHNFFVIREHGFVSKGKNMKEAGENALFLLEKIENSNYQ